MSTDDKYILHGGPVPDIYKVSFKSIGSIYLNRLRTDKDVLLFTNGNTSEQLTTTQLLHRSAILANSLLKFGIKHGDVVAICSENCFEFFYASIASYLIGAIVTPFNPKYKSDELAHVIDLSKPKIIFASAGAVDKLVGVVSIRPFVQKVVLFADACLRKGITTYMQFTQNVQPLDTFPCESKDWNDDVTLILYSSGTTGKPKGVVLTNYHLLRSMEQRRVIENFEYRCMNCLPWFHSYGYMSICYLTLFYSNSIFLKQFDERIFLNCIQKHKINYLFSVPAILVFLAKSFLVDQYDISSIKAIVVGSAPLPKKIITALKSKLTDVRIIEGYGMTESTLTLLRQTDDNNKVGSVGVLTVGNRGKVVDVETGRCLGPNQRGELCFKGPTIMKGYLNNVKDTKQTIDEDGWLHTGDIGYYDEDGEWFIVDRLKELIKYKGFQVAPAELETVLMEHGKIFDAAVVGTPDEMAGELPMAFVVLRDGMKATEKEIKDYVAGKVSSIKQLRGGVKFMKTIPRNAAGKILRRELKLLGQGTKSKL